MARKLAVEIVGDASSLEKALKKSSKATADFGRNVEKAGRKRGGPFGSMTKSALGLAGGLVGVGGLAAAAKAAFGEFADAQKVTAQTNAALKSTGGIANVTAKHVDALANSMLNKTGIDDEAIKTSENMLLTFTNIRNEVGKGSKIFDRATQATADLATRMNQGAIPSSEQLQKASLQLGKALNDPVRGIGALSRVGIQFTNQQKDTIKQLVKTGDVLGAQKVILKEVNKEFGGSAKAAGQTLSGQLSKLRNTALNLGASLAETLAPQLRKLLDAANKWLSNSKNQKQVLDLVKQAAGAVSAGFRVLKGIFEGLNKITGSSKHTFELLLGTLVAIKGLKMASSIANTARQIGLLGKNSETALGSVKGLNSGLAGKAGLAGGVALAGYELSTMIRKIPGWDKKMKAFGGTIEGVASSLGLIKDPMAQFKGTRIVGQGGTKLLIAQARQLERAGRTPAQAAKAIVRSHPNVAQHDAQVFANAAARQIARGAGGGRRLQAAGAGGGGVTINGPVHFHGIQDMRKLEDALVKRSKSRPRPRRGT